MKRRPVRGDDRAPEAPFAAVRSRWGLDRIVGGGFHRPLQIFRWGALPSAKIAQIAWLSGIPCMARRQSQACQSEVVTRLWCLENQHMTGSGKHI